MIEWHNAGFFCQTKSSQHYPEPVIKISPWVLHDDSAKQRDTIDYKPTWNKNSTECYISAFSTSLLKHKLQPPIELVGGGTGMNKLLQPLGCEKWHGDISAYA